MIRVLIIDDEALVRAGLRMILESAEDISVVGEADDGAEAVDAIERSQPDVVLMDIRMPRLDGLAATVAVRALGPKPPVMILTTFDLDDYVFRALQAGADGFLLKDTPPLELINAVRVLANGESMLSPSVTRRLISHFNASSGAPRRDQARQSLSDLSPREHEVLAEVGRGRSNAEIGATLFMSEATVKAHVSHLLTKLQRANRVQLAILAHDAGITDD
ncbi:MAG: response regulator transcription factor [Acidimicrobiales bacterium]